MNTQAGNTRSFRLYALTGFTFIVLSFVLTYATWRMIYGAQVLGVQSEMMNSGSTDSIQQNTEVNIQSGPQQLPTQDQPSQNLPSDDTQQIGSPTTEIVVSNPTTEIVIENTDTELVITDASTDTEIVTVPAVQPTYDDGGVYIGTSPSSPTSPTAPSNDSPSVTTTTVPDSAVVGSGVPTVVSKVPGITTTTYSYSQKTSTSQQTAQTGETGTTIMTSVTQRFARPLSYIGIGSDTGSASTVPPDAVTIQYTPSGQTQNLDAWLKDYQFQVWAVGKDTVAIYRHGITTYTTDAIKLGLSKLSFQLLTDSGELPVTFYPDTVWTYLSDIREISKDTHDQPMRLVSEGGTLRYQVHAHSRQLLFAAIPVSICRNIVVAVTTRDILDSRACTQFDSLLDTFSLAL